MFHKDTVFTVRWFDKDTLDIKATRKANGETLEIRNLIQVDDAMHHRWLLHETMLFMDEKINKYISDQAMKEKQHD